jgi:hypothetical protein
VKRIEYLLELRVAVAGQDAVAGKPKQPDGDGPGTI